MNNLAAGAQVTIEVRITAASNTGANAPETSTCSFVDQPDRRRSTSYGSITRA